MEINTKTKIVMRKIESVRPYEKNPRRNDEAVPAVVESIKQYGFKVPLVIDADGVIVTGHTRYKAARELGLVSVPCIVADDLTPEQIKGFRLVDNKTSELAEWDFDLLNEELLDIGESSVLELFDFEDAELDSDGAEEKDETDTPPGFNYHEQYGVIVLCADKAAQEEIYNRLTGEGYECKVVTT